MEYFILGFLALNTIILVGIAGSLAKMIRYMQSQDGPRDEWAGIIRDRRVLDTQSRPLNYTDAIQDDRPSNWDGLSRISPNWDGVPVKS